MLSKKSTAAWAEIGGKRCYFRSLWERNFSRWLQYQKEHGMILDWQHEPYTFWFDKIKRGVRSYKPDFYVLISHTQGDHYWVEVKGYKDPKSLTKLKRMKLYHPDQTIRLIDAKWFADNNQKMRILIPGWEIGENTLPKIKTQAQKK
jgi:hypothetical protein